MLRGTNEMSASVAGITSIGVAPAQRLPGSPLPLEWKPDPLAGKDIRCNKKRGGRDLFHTKQWHEIYISFLVSYNLYKIYMLCSTMRQVMARFVSVWWKLFLTH